METANGYEMQLVVFKLGSEVYGIEIEHIKEIITMRPITGLPKSSRFVEGIINLRGIVIPIYNLREKFGLPRKEDDKDTRIIVVESTNQVVGLVVDAVNEVIRVNSNALEAPGELVTQGVENGFVRSVAKVEDRLVLILELSGIISGRAGYGADNHIAV